MRKALAIGINNYNNGSSLLAPVNDATAIAGILETHGDGDPNFTVDLGLDLTTRDQLLEMMHEHFSVECDVSLFYYSGHGYENNLGTYLVTPDATKFNPGVSMNDLLILANECRAPNKIIILDCCYSGAAGTSRITGNKMCTINRGVTILTASKPDQLAVEVEGRSVFTNLLIEGLRGGAADIGGNITPGSIYAYIDQALKVNEQRPVFKTNITEFVSLRKINPKVPKSILRKIASYFPSPDAYFALDPSFEDTNSPEVVHDLVDPYANPANVLIFKDLQKLQSVGLVVPVGAPFMYFAAMQSKACRLTPLGAHYWRLASRKMIR